MNRNLVFPTENPACIKNYEELHRTISVTYCSDIEEEPKLAFGNFGELINLTPFTKYSSHPESPTQSVTTSGQSTSSPSPQSDSSPIKVDESIIKATRENKKTFNYKILENAKLTKGRALPLGRKSLFARYSKEEELNARKVGSLTNL